MKTITVSLTCLALGLIACNAKEEGTDTEAFLEGVPEQAALELSVAQDSSAEGLASDDEAIATNLATLELMQVSDALAEGLQSTQGAVRELNQTLRNFLEPIVGMVRNTEPDAVQGNVAMWGPVTRGATEYRFFLRKGVAKRFGWVLQGRAGGSDDSYTNVAAGNIAVGEIARRGVGRIGVDLDAFGAVDPTVAARGKLLASFAHGTRGTVLAYGLKEFTRDADDTTPISAAFQGVHLIGGQNRVRLAFHGNLPESETDAEELLLARVRHHRGSGGRADMLVTGGDVPDGRIWVVSECWNAGAESGFRAVLDCPGDGVGGEQCETVKTTGAVANCLSDLQQAELPPSDPEEHMDDEESPEPDLLPPDEMPSGEAS